MKDKGKESVGRRMRGQEGKTADTRPSQRSQAEAERGKYDCREESGGRRVKAKKARLRTPGQGKGAKLKQREASVTAGRRVEAED